MNEQDQAALEQLAQRQQALHSRLQACEAGLETERQRLQTSRQTLEELRQQQTALLDELRHLAAHLAGLRARLPPAPAPAPPPASPAARPPTPEAQAPPALPLSPPPLPPQAAPPAPATEPAPPIIPATTPPPAASPASQPGAAPEPALAETAEAPAPPAPSSFELRLGTYWLVRLGIVALLTGMVFLANFAYQNYARRLGPGGKVVALYALSFGLLGLGAWLHRRQAALRNYARVLVAGGLAAVYFTTYAAHHVANLRLIGSAALDGALLLAWAAFIVGLADRARSEVLALLATVLGYYTAIITTVGAFTLYSNLVLTLASLVFLVRHRWALLSTVSLGASYCAYAFWRFFHQGEWRWASPEEGLWKGVYFLASYWVLFTAAALLSKHPRLAGRNRATFATLNNGAFVGLFLLTMAQVRTGGFWKFALIFGAVLLGLAALAARMWPQEKVTVQALLAQGLLLVTLGLVLHFSGLNLALLLVFESAGLLVLGRLLGQPIMRWAAWVTGAMALGWLTASLQAREWRGLLTGSVVGAGLLFNAQWERREQATVRPQPGAGLVFFTALALAAWAFATWRNVEPRWLAVAWAAESGAVLLAGRPLGNRALLAGAFPLALLGTGAALVELLEQSGYPLAQRTGLGPAALAGALVLFNAWWARRRLDSPAAPDFAPASATFASLGLLTWLAATWVFAPPEWLALVLAAEAGALTLAGLGLGMTEMAVLAQLFLVLGQLNCLACLAPMEGLLNSANLTKLPWWNPAGVLGLTLALSHGWQRWPLPGRLSRAPQVCQGLFALAAVLVLMFWLKPQVSPAAWMALACLLALGVAVYGGLTRAWWLAAAGQILLWTGVIEFGRQVAFDTGLPRPAWSYALVPVAALIGLPFLLPLGLARARGAAAETKDRLRQVSRLYQAMAGLLAVGWVFEYVPARDRFWALAAIGAGLFAWAGFRGARGALWAGGGFTALGLLVLWWHFDSAGIVYLPNLLAVLLVLAQQQAARRWSELFAVPEPAHQTVMLVGGGSLGLLLSRWVLLQSGGFFLTVAWTGLALVIFLAGFGLRERMYRWLGLAVLGGALVRVVLYDVWKLETIHRILSLLALGAGLLLLGFLYNRYQDKIRQWL